MSQKKEKRNEILIIRLTPKEKAAVKVRAQAYFGGDLSKFVRFCVKNYRGKFKK